MVEYMLISVFERSIMTEIFDNIKDARQAMLRELRDQAIQKDVEIDTTLDCVDDEELYGYGSDWAWSNIDDDCNCDWKIVELPWRY